MGNILETLVEIGGLNNFIKLIKIVDYANMLDSEGPYTIFAPLDEAFTELPTDILDNLLAGGEGLVNVLDNHLILGEYTTDDLRETPLLTTAEGDNISIDILDDTLKVNDADIVRPDVQFSGGWVQIIDSVLLPEGRYE